MNIRFLLFFVFMATFTFPVVPAISQSVAGCQQIDCSAKQIVCQRGAPGAKLRCERKKAIWKVKCETKKQACLRDR